MVGSGGPSLKGHVVPFSCLIVHDIPVLLINVTLSPCPPCQSLHTSSVWSAIFSPYNVNSTRWGKLFTSAPATAPPVAGIPDCRANCETREGRQSCSPHNRPALPSPAIRPQLQRRPDCCTQPPRPAGCPYHCFHIAKIAADTS